MISSSNGLVQGFGQPASVTHDIYLDMRHRSRSLQLPRVLCGLREGDVYQFRQTYTVQWVLKKADISQLQPDLLEF